MKQYLKYLLLIVILTTTQLSWAATPTAYLDDGFGINSLAQEGAVVASVKNPEGIFWNPASLATISGIYITSMFNKKFSEVDEYYLSIGIPIGGGVGALTYFGSGVTDILGSTYDSSMGQGNLTGQNYAFKGHYLAGSWANTWGSVIHYGITAKYLATTLVKNQASGFGIDIGAHYLLNRNTILGLSVQNILTTPFTWDTETGYAETLPLILQTGLRTQILTDIDCEADYQWKPNREGIVLLGAEWTLGDLILRGGLSNKHYSLGVQYTYQGLKLNYSYTFNKDDLLTNTSRFGLAFDCGDTVSEPKQSTTHTPTKKILNTTSAIHKTIETATETSMHANAVLIPANESPESNNSFIMQIHLTTDGTSKTTLKGNGYHIAQFQVNRQNVPIRDNGKFYIKIVQNQLEYPLMITLENGQVLAGTITIVPPNKLIFQGLTLIQGAISVNTVPVYIKSDGRFFHKLIGKDKLPEDVLIQIL